MTKTSLRPRIKAFFLLFKFFPVALRSRKKRFPESHTPRIRYRINDFIKAPTLRVIDEEGGLLGVMSREEALMKAREAGVDLVEISPNAQPPVAKVIDYGKMLYTLKKKDHQARKAGKALEQKGIRFSFRTGVGDMDRLRKQAQEFLEKGHPVKVQLTLKGRENAHKDLAFAKVKDFVLSLEAFGKADEFPRAMGFQIIVTIRPTKTV